MGENSLFILNWRNGQLCDPNSGGDNSSIQFCNQECRFFLRSEGKMIILLLDDGLEGNSYYLKKSLKSSHDVKEQLKVLIAHEKWFWFPNEISKAFWSFGFDRTWRSLFQKFIMYNKFDIYILITTKHLHIFIEKYYFCNNFLVNIFFNNTELIQISFMQ